MAQFALVDGRRRNHTESIACREPSRLPFGPARGRLYLLAEHAAANGQEHRFCQVVMRHVQMAFVEAEGMGVAAALTKALQLVNRALWEEGQELPPLKRLPIGLVAAAIDGADAYFCQIATGQVFVSRGGEAVSLPGLSHWHDVHAGAVAPTPALGQAPDLAPVIGHCRLAPGDLLVLSATNLARLIDAPTLANLSSEGGEAVVTQLCTLAEDFGLLHTSGMTLRILETPSAAAERLPLSLAMVGASPAESTVASRPGLADRLGQVWRRPVANAAPAVGEPDLTAVAAEPPVEAEPVPDEPLPDNIVRLYTSPPLATLAAAPEVADEPDLTAVAAAPPAEEAPPPRRPTPPTRSVRARWLDALAASMVVATESLRGAGVVAPARPVARPAARRPARSAASRPIAPEPVYRATGGMTPAVADALAGTATLRASGLRLPTANASNVPLLALAGVALALILAAGVNMLIRPAGPPAFRSEPAPATGAASAEQWTAAPTISELTLARLTSTQAAAEAVAPPAGGAASTPVADAPAPVSAESVTAEGATASRGASPATTGTNDGSRLGPVTVLADLTATNTPATTPKQLIVGRGNLYVLDPYTSTLYLIDSAGKAPTPLLTRGWSIGREKVTDLVGATWRGDTLVVMDRHRAYTLDGPNGTWRVAPLAAAGLGAGVHPIDTFEGSLYVLDSVRNQVLKFTKGAYARPPLPWLKQPEKVDLSGAVDIAIDGRIYALTASGQLLTLSRGALEKRQPIQATPALQAPAALISPANSDFLYVAESNGRILKLTKDGAVAAQFRPADGNAELANLSALAVDEASQTIYAVAGNRIVRLAMPDGHRPRAPLS
jgi:hypothetical protein